MSTRALLVAAALWALPLTAVRGQQESDFQVGDLVLLRVEGDSQLTDTFTVAAGPVLPLPIIGDVPLAGVRRAELEEYLTQFLRRFLKEPVVRARSLLRLSVTGEVEQPGFYPVAGDLVLSDVIMQAGGPTREADLKKLRIERGERRLWEGETLQRAVEQRRTLDELDLRAGDRVIVPRERNTERTLRIIGMLVTIPAALIYGITQVF